MAVVDKYTNSTASADKAVYNAYDVNGQVAVSMVATYTPAAGDSANSVYRFFKDVPSNLVPLRGAFMTSSNVSTGTCEIGVYKPNSGAAADSDCLSAALSTATASRTLDPFASIAIADSEKSLAELAGLDPSKYPVVDIGVKALSAFGAQDLALQLTFLRKY